MTGQYGAQNRQNCGARHSCGHNKRRMDARTQRARELRHTSTEAERRLWQHLRAHRLRGHHFKRQERIGPYIVDFICRPRRLIIEIDGEDHQSQLEADRQRTHFLEALGYTVLRFSNHDVFVRTDSVELHPPLRSYPSPLGEG